MITKNLPAVKERLVSKADTFTAICEQMFRKCGNFDVSQPYWSPWPVKGIQTKSVTLDSE
jgi:hypothetical protein